MSLIRPLRYAAAAALLLSAAACVRETPARGCRQDSECSAGEACSPLGLCLACPACEDGESCIGGMCLPAVCSDVPCHKGEGCLNGRCVDSRCVGVQCPAGQACARGSCYPHHCADFECTEASVCYENSCVAPSCLGVPCAAGEVCADGVCTSQSCVGVSCAKGTGCLNGRCVALACVGVSCPAGSLCANGRCVSSQCGGGTCPAGQVCQAGNCTQASCVGAACEPGSRCDDGQCLACVAAETEAVCADGKDNDCDGKVDCADEECASTGACHCPAIPCEANQHCVGGQCLPAACGDHPCREGEGCVGGQCVPDACLNVSCPEGQACATYLRGAEVATKCYNLDCPGQDCAAGDVCYANAFCVATNCLTLTMLDECGTTEVCANGQCIPGTCEGLTCAQGAACDGGDRCVARSCIGLECPADTLCAAGRCLPTASPDGATPCPAGQVFVNGACGDHSCDGLSCAAGLRCSGAACVPCTDAETNCSDGVDENCNTLTDCLDPACGEAEACKCRHLPTELNCHDNIDDDCDGEPDCADQECENKGVEQNCGDGVDNDCDGQFDCDDMDCQGLACEDGDPCTLDDRCQSNLKCEGTLNPCNTPPNASCFLAQGRCEADQQGKCVYDVNPAKIGVKCNDGDACSDGETCNALGECTGATPRTCDDANECTVDSCDSGLGCAHERKPDGESCGTAGETCQGGFCGCTGAAELNCHDGIDEDCDLKIDCADEDCRDAICDDRSLCTTGETCQSDMCTAGTPKDCGAPPGECYEPVASCTPGDGTCHFAYKAEGSSCGDDNLACTDDVCDGAGKCTHPVKAKESLCRPSAGFCDVEERCDGVASACPADGFADSTVVCNPSKGACDPEEKCSGTAASCPADALADTSVVCRAAVPGGCDVEERCDGAAVDCPTDTWVASGTTCREATGDCDVAEACTGTGPTCPLDAVATTAVTCREAVPGGCDVAETCDGTGKACPADVVAESTVNCRPAAPGTCDVDEFCTGASNSCPADAVALPGTVCRDSAGGCDVAETCDGTLATCPADGFASAITPCADDGNACTEDLCEGTSNTCNHPTKPNNADCGSMGEFCTDGVCGCGTAVTETSCTDGADNNCNAKKDCADDDCAGQPCNDGNACTEGEVCSGGACGGGIPKTCAPAAECYEATVTCDPATGNCIYTPKGAGSACADDGNPCTDDVCDGAGACTHPADDTNACDDGKVCTTGDACSAGTCAGTVSCPPATGECYEAAGTCDASGACTYAPKASGTACADDANPCTVDQCDGAGTCAHIAAPAGTVCREQNGDCDVAETCSGTTCPGDGFANGSTLCRPSAGSCDAAEYCSGTSASCPTDQPKAAGTSCGSSTYGSCGACGSFSDTCDTTGTQSCTRYDPVCSGFSCVTQTTSETLSCSRSTNGTSCGSPSYTDWGACAGFAEPCGTVGVQYRTRTEYYCSGGGCAGTNYTESQACYRATDGITCAATTYSSWVCRAYASTCDNAAGADRTRYDYRCSAGSCAVFPAGEYGAGICTRNTNGTDCNGGTTCQAWSEVTCNYSGACDANGTETRSCTDRKCSSGSCQASTRNESRGCSRTIANGKPCTGGFCCGAGNCVSGNGPNHCGACGADCGARACNGGMCSCATNSYCLNIYGGSATCYNGTCNCGGSCPGGASCKVVTGTNYCYYP